MTRLRAVVVVVVVLVLGAWTCQVPTDSPGSAGSADVPITTTGLTALVAGEDWHYVGDATTGLGTTFGTHWTNVATSQRLAFRIRESGIIDIQGQIRNTSDPTEVIFTLPVGYRPVTGSAIPIAGASVFGGTGTLQACLLIVEADGTVYLSRVVSSVNSPPAAPYIYAQVFIDPPTA